MYIIYMIYNIQYTTEPLLAVSGVGSWFIGFCKGFHSSKYSNLYFCPVCVMNIKYKTSSYYRSHNIKTEVELLTQHFVAKLFFFFHHSIQVINKIIYISIFFNILWDI